jgi:protein-S-isoprenylcysteine O-methyltransferase
VFYHNGEFIFVVTCHYELLGYDSFLIYHSNAYQIAQWLGVLEFLIESYFFPDYKNFLTGFFMFGFGVTMVIGMICRMSAFYYANVSFTHLVSTTKEQDHVLVTNGIYQFSRHPSYFGYFLFAVSGQLLMKNFVCAVAYVLVLWNFFLERLSIEEPALEEFFGGKYREFRSQVPTRIPFLDSALEKRLASTETTD